MRVVGRAVAALCVFGVAASVAAADRGLKGHKYVEGEVIVKFKTGVMAASMPATIQSAISGASVARSMVVRTREGLGHLALVRTPRGQTTVEELVRQFSALPDVEYAEPNFIASTPGETPTAATAKPWPARTFGRPRGTASTRETSHRDRELARLSASRDDAASAREVSGESLVGMGVYPSEHYFQWGWGYLSSDVIWKNASASPLVAVIDTGVDYTHPDLAGKVVKGRNFVADTADPMDDNGHGTHVAGVIAARLNNKVGISGVSNGNVLAVKALDFAGFGTHWEIAQAIRYAASYPGVKVINMSLGGYADSTTLSDAVNYAVAAPPAGKGKLLVAAAGNDNVSTRLYPAAYSDNPAFVNRVLAVAASGVYVTPSSGGDDVLVGYCKALYSNYGTWVNIMAPGTDIISTLPTKASWFGYNYGLYNYGTLSGTSMATPHVAGMAGRVWSVNPLFTNVQIARRLTEGGTWPPAPADVAPGPVYRAYTGPVDVDFDTTNEITNCWDPAFASGRPVLPDMADADVAIGMQRGEISAWIYDAANGNALPSGTVVQAWQGAVLKGQTAMTSNLDQMGVVISNLPWYLNGYTMKVNKAGYTMGAQTFGSVWLPWSSWVRVGFDTDLALPKISSNRTFVTNYPTYWDDVDQHLLLPPATAFDVGTDFGGAKTTITSLPLGGYGTGTLVGVPPLCAPCSRYMADSHFTGFQGVETTAAKSLFPTTTGPYRLFNRDYSHGADLIESFLYGADYDSLPVGPTMRLWQGGVIKATVSADDATVQSSPSPVCDFIGGGTAVCDKWYVGNLSSAGVFTPVNIIGDGVNDAVVPFGGANAKAGIAATTP